MHVLIDTDAGVDDTLALVYAARSPEIEVEMITTVSGNVPVSEVTQNVLYLKELLRLDISVFSGADVPRARKLVTAPEVHGEDGVGGYRKSQGISIAGWETRDAAMRIVSAANRFGKKLTIVSLGPMTNLANAVAIDADALRGVNSIIQMGGVFSGYGNTTEFTEFNIFVDPEAADFILNNGVRIKFVPLDLTEKLLIPREVFDTLIKSSPASDKKLAQLLQKAVRYYLRYHREHDDLDGCYLHDPIAMAVAVNPSWFEFVDSSVSIETKGDLTSGMTVADFRSARRKGNSEVAIAFDAKEFLRDFTRKVFGSPLKPDTIAKRCLNDRFSQQFRTRLSNSGQ